MAVFRVRDPTAAGANAADRHPAASATPDERPAAAPVPADGAPPDGGRRWDAAFQENQTAGATQGADATYKSRHESKSRDFLPQRPRESVNLRG